MPLEWRTLPTENCRVSTCGRYAVSVCDGQWSAWKLAPGGPWFAPLAQKLADQESAERLCNEDSWR